MRYWSVLVFSREHVVLVPAVWAFNAEGAKRHARPEFIRRFGEPPGGSCQYRVRPITFEEYQARCRRPVQGRNR